MTSINPADVKLQPATAGDEPFLRDLYEDSRRWELGPLAAGGNEHFYQTVINQQYESQHTEYFQHFDKARYAIVYWDTTPVGKIYVDYRDNEVRILDIAIHSSYQGKGIAGCVLRGICIDAAFRGLPVRLTVSVLNKAIRLYLALGFVKSGEPSPLQEMEWFHPKPDEILRGKFLPSSCIEPV